MLKCWIFSFGLLTNNDTVNILCAKNENKCKQRFIMLLLLSVVDVPYGEFWHRVNYEHAQHSQTNPILCEVSCSMFAALRFGCNPALLKCPVQNRISDFFKFFIKLNIGKKIRLKRFFFDNYLEANLIFLDWSRNIFKFGAQHGVDFREEERFKVNRNICSLPNTKHKAYALISCENYCEGQPVGIALDLLTLKTSCTE